MDIIRLELSIVIFTSLLSCIVSRAGPQKDADWTKRLAPNHIKRKNDARADGIDLDRRDAFQLANMVETIIPGASATDYLSYGCYCGFGGKGEPVDEIDRCCQQHDRCYGGLTAQFGCSEWWRYFNRYDWKVDANKDVVCLPSSDKCKHGQCLCDRSMVKCFQKNRSVYNNQFTGFWWTFFKQC